MEEALAVNKDKETVDIIIHTIAKALAIAPFGALSPYLEKGNLF